MGRLKWHYILNILLLSVLLTTAVACDEGALPEVVSPDSVPRDMHTPSTSLEGLPVINEFYTNWDNWGVSDQVILYWDVSGASLVSIAPDIGEVSLSGEIRVSSPSGSMMEDTTFILTASNEVGSVTASTVVCSGPITNTMPTGSGTPKSTLKPTEESGYTEPIKVVLPIIHSFRADPESIYLGSPTKLRWEVSNADEITITALKFSETGLPSSGSIVVSPTTTTTYTITATNSEGSCNLNVTAIVVNPNTLESIPSIPTGDAIIWEYVIGDKGLEPAALPTIHSFTIDPESIFAGHSAMLRWEVSNADRIYIGRDILLMSYFDSSGYFPVMPTTTSTYYLRAANNVGSVSQNVTLTVMEPATPETVTQLEPVGLPTIHYFRADPESIAAGGSSTLSWEVSNADLILIYSTWIENVRLYREEDPGASASGSISVTPPYSDYTETYHLTATNGAGSSSALVSVTITSTQTPEPPPSQPKDKPDLIIIDIWRSGTAQWHYIVKNQGKVECSRSSSELRIDGKGQASQSISPLAPGESREFYFSHKFACETGTSHTWAVVADIKGAVDEGDEGNNTRVEKFICTK